MNHAAIFVNGLKKSFKNKEVLKGVDLEVSRGEIFALFLDEPTTGLDPEARMEVWSTIKELAGSGTTILLTTQYLEEAEQLADRISILHDGKIITTGTLAELKVMFPPTKVEYIEKQPTLEDIFLEIVRKKEEE